MLNSTGQNNNNQQNTVIYPRELGICTQPLAFGIRDVTRHACGLSHQPRVHVSPRSVPSQRCSSLRDKTAKRPRSNTGYSSCDKTSFSQVTRHCRAHETSPTVQPSTSYFCPITLLSLILRIWHLGPISAAPFPAGAAALGLRAEQRGLG